MQEGNLTGRLWRLRPARLLAEQRAALQRVLAEVRSLARLRVEAFRTRTAGLGARLKLLGPEQVLARGYSITRDAVSGAVIRSARQVKPGQRLRTRLHDGEFPSRAEPGNGVK